MAKIFKLLMNELVSRYIVIRTSGVIYIWIEISEVYCLKNNAMDWKVVLAVR